VILEPPAYEPFMPEERADPPFRTGDGSRNGLGSEADGRGGTIRAWCVDLALAYVIGLMIGAPAGLAATWITRSKLALTAVIVVAMVAAFVVRRVRRRSTSAV
jgi:hypothetical protein